MSLLGHSASYTIFNNLAILFCCSLVSKSCLTLCNPMDGSPPGSPVRGISEARILEWVAISFSRGSSRHRDWTHISCTQANSLPLSYLRSSVILLCYLFIFYFPESINETHTELLFKEKRGKRSISLLKRLEEELWDCVRKGWWYKMDVIFCWQRQAGALTGHGKHGLHTVIEIQVTIQV